MEFDIVDNECIEGVRPCRTVLSLTEFTAGRTLVVGIWFDVHGADSLVFVL